MHVHSTRRTLHPQQPPRHLLRAQLHIHNSLLGKLIYILLFLVRPHLLLVVLSTLVHILIMYLHWYFPL